MGAIEKIRVKKRVKIVEIRVMLKLVLILALVAAALAAPLGEVPRRPNPLAFHRTRGFYEGLLEFWSRIRVTQKDPCDTSCGTRQDGQGQKDPCDTSCGTGQDGQGQKDPCDTSCGTGQT